MKRQEVLKALMAAPYVGPLLHPQVMANCCFVCRKTTRSDRQFYKLCVHPSPDSPMHTLLCASCFGGWRKIHEAELLALEMMSDG